VADKAAPTEAANDVAEEEHDANSKLALVRSSAANSSRAEERRPRGKVRRAKFRRDPKTHCDCTYCFVARRREKSQSSTLTEARESKVKYAAHISRARAEVV
jgi:hypothetical protein